MKEFLHKRVKGGGAITGSHQLQDKYLPQVYADAKQDLKEKLVDCKVSVIFDETPDTEGRCVLNILLAPLKKDDSNRIVSYLVDTVFMDKCDHSTVSQAIIKVLHEYEIKSENVISFNTDNAAYMLKAFNTVLTNLFANSVHITCLSHICNLIGDTFKKPFDEVNSFLLYMTRVFYMAGSRKRRYMKFLTDKMPQSRATMCPNPCTTRWNSWFEAVLYHSKHFHLYKSFIEAEMASCSSIPDSLENLNRILQNKETHDSCMIQLAIIADKCMPIVQLTDLFQGHSSLTVRVFEYLEDMMINFTNNSVLAYDAVQTHFDNDAGDTMSMRTKLNIIKLVTEAYCLAMDKLTKYMEHGQPAIDFLKQCRIFNPRRLALISTVKADYTAIPGMQDVPDQEFRAYVEIHGPAAVAASVSGLVDLDLFWIGIQDILPNLSRIAIIYKDVVTSTADAERSNSLYKLVLNARRRSLSEKSLRALLFLYYNQRLTSGSAGDDDDFEIDVELY